MSKLVLMCDYSIDQIVFEFNGKHLEVQILDADLPSYVKLTKSDAIKIRDYIDNVLWVMGDA